jgi:hypothetical protein
MKVKVYPLNIILKSYLLFKTFYDKLKLLKKKIIFSNENTIYK